MKQSLNRIINALGLLTFVSMISTGIILKWILPPGSGRVESLMRGGFGQNKTIAILMGLTRHEWGEIHFYISIAFLIILIIHFVLHWDWIRATAWGTKKCPQSSLRRWMTIGIVIFIVISLALPWVLERKEMTKAAFLDRGSPIRSSL